MSPPLDPKNAKAPDGTRSFTGRPKVVDSHLETRDQKHVLDASTDAGLSTPTPLLTPLPEKYEFRRILGRGGMGEVLHVYDTDLRRDVALKFMRRQAATSPTLCRRFLEEARILAQLKHRSVVRVLERGEIDGRPYFAMDYLSGATLNDRRAEFRTSAAVAVAVVIEVAAGVQHAHDQGIYHRDLKASNVVFDGSWPVVTDFGCAKWEEGELSTQGVALFGTPSHMAPEVWEQGSKEHDARADLWSLGVMLFHLLAGELPFPDDPRTPEGREALLERDPTPIRQCDKVAPGVDERLEAIVGKTLAKNPVERYQTVAAFGAELSEWLSGAGALATPETNATATPAIAGRRSRMPLLAVVASITLIVTVTAFVIAWWPKPTPTTDPDPAPQAKKKTLAERLLKPGDSVPLIDETGLPIEPFTKAEGMSGDVRVSLSGHCELSDTRAMMLDLGEVDFDFPVRLDAEARLSLILGDSKVGTYFDRKAHLQPNGTFAHVACVCCFGRYSEAPDTPEWKSKWVANATGARIYPADETPNFFVPERENWKSTPIPKKEPGTNFYVFEPISLEFHPAGRYSGQYSTFLFPTVDRKLSERGLLKGVFEMNQEAARPPLFGHRFGLFVTQGDGQFRNVRLTRLPN